MKATVASLMMLIVLSALFAEVGFFNTLDSGHFAGKMATYASGDTIMYVTRSQDNGIVLYRSTNGGSSWISNSSIFSPIPQGDTAKPTLSVSYGECIITAGKYYACSLDGGINWQTPIQWDGSFENSPYIEKYGNELKLFNLSLPYPEDRQNEFLIEGTNEFASPQILIDNHESTNETNMYFMGQDVATGTVRINGDMIIKQAGGGDNSGFPTFLAPVIISGEVVSYPEYYPIDQVFQGGLITHAPPLDLPDGFWQRMNGIMVGPPTYNPDNIVMIEVSGNSYTGWLGKIQIPHRVHADVWEDYPLHPYAIDAPPLYRNNFTVRDTLWYPLPSGSSYGTHFVNGKLWIKGNFSGHQTWCSADTIMIIGDITLTGTTPGENPYPNNTTDSVNLISEKSILLKYGYRDPSDSTRIHPLCRADNDPIHIYASLYALGDGHGNSRKDGVFSFEYQHPHGSIEPKWIDLPEQGLTLFDMIDLHRNRYPQTAAEPWNPHLDYPWYNPLYPEEKPYLERGTVKVWGSIVQKRHGYLHRSYYDNEYPSAGVWNPALDYCGATSAPNNQTFLLWQNPPAYAQLTTRNYPGATGSGIGYKKTHVADRRNSLSSGANNPEESLWTFGMMFKNKPVDNPELGFSRLFFRPQVKPTTGKSFTRKGGVALYSANDLLVIEQNDGHKDISVGTQDGGTIQATAIKNINQPLVYQLTSDNNSLAMNLKEISAITGAVQNQNSLPVSTKMNDIAVLGNNRTIMAKYEANGFISLWELDESLQASHLENWILDVPPPNPPLIVSAQSRLFLIPSAENALEVFLLIKPDSAGEDNSEPDLLYHAHASFPVSNNDPAIPAIGSINLQAYPNPMRDELKLSVELASNATHRVDIYNLRGQKVKSLSGSSKGKDGSYNYVWNGTDEQGKITGSGIYIVKLLVENKGVQTKRICRY
ncbi:MAG: T9SS type A sorting domain-containing protein [Candidatus Cloacimonetes bacterium]|nr:T9SS type A sorting domain-containing protein [Candidatus Cloacimonadota bacterium]